MVDANDRQFHHSRNQALRIRELEAEVERLAGEYADLVHQYDGINDDLLAENERLQHEVERPTTTSQTGCFTSGEWTA